MSHQSTGSPTRERQSAGSARPEPAAPPTASCASRANDQAAVCPACGDEMRLWANYHRCRNCGYKESCCF
jgi:hypothetical protein